MLSPGHVSLAVSARERAAVSEGLVARVTVRRSEWNVDRPA